MSNPNAILERFEAAPKVMPDDTHIQQIVVTYEGKILGPFTDTNEAVAWCIAKLGVGGWSIEMMESPATAYRWRPGPDATKNPSVGRANQQ